MIRRFAIALGLLFSAGARLASAQAFDLPWSALNSGSELMVGGTFRLVAVVSQDDVVAMSGGPFALVGGFLNPVSTDPCIGDLNGDRQVNLPDLAGLLTNFGATSGVEYQDGDLDGNGSIDLTDLATLLTRFGTACPT
ncbi:MAG: hypothetical protein ACKVS9_19870 [Phycisphaerae bacterium]